MKLKVFFKTGVTELFEVDEHADLTFIPDTDAISIYSEHMYYVFHWSAIDRAELYMLDYKENQ